LVDVLLGLIAVFESAIGEAVATTTTVEGAFVAVGNGVGDGPPPPPPGFPGLFGTDGVDEPPPPPPQPANATATPKTKSNRFIFALDVTR
jgi:hypothetical protein